MLWHVWNRVSLAQRIGEVWILTDDKGVQEQAQSWGARVMMTSEDCASGTDRIASVAHLLDADIIVNVQADEPVAMNQIREMLNQLEICNKPCDKSKVGGKTHSLL